MLYLRMTDGETLRQLRRDLGLSQTAVAKAARVERTTLSIIENGSAERGRVLAALKALKAERVNT